MKPGRHVSGSRRFKAAVKVNIELIRMYWDLGKDIVKKQSESKWGNGFFADLSQDLKDEFPDMEGFSVTNLKYMKRMYLFYSQDDVIRHQLGDELEQQIFSIPWRHHIEIIVKKKSVAEALRANALKLYGENLHEYFITPPCTFSFCSNTSF